MLTCPNQCFYISDWTNVLAIHAGEKQHSAYIFFNIDRYCAIHIPLSSALSIFLLAFSYFLHFMYDESLVFLSFSVSEFCFDAPISENSIHGLFSILLGNILMFLTS